MEDIYYPDNELKKLITSPNSNPSKSYRPKEKKINNK